MVDSLRAEIQKAVLDSVTRVRQVPGNFTFLTGDARIDSMVRRLQRDAERRGNRGMGVLPPDVPREPSGPDASTLTREAFAARLETLGPPRRLFVSFPSLSSRSRFLAPQVDSVVDSLRRTLARDGRYILVPADSVRDILGRTRTISAISDSMKVDLFASVGASVMPDTSVIWQITTRDLGAHSSLASRTVTMHGFRPNVLAGLNELVTGSVRFLREQDRAPRRSTQRGVRDNR